MANCEADTDIVATANKEAVRTTSERRMVDAVGGLAIARKERWKKWDNNASVTGRPD